MKNPTNPIDIHLGKKLRQIREISGITQDKLGELVGVAAQQIQKYEMATNRISASRLYEFAQIFEKPISAFYEGCVADRDFHNIDFKSEKDLEKIEEEKNKEIKNLIKEFSQISSFEVRDNLISLIKSLKK